MGSPCKQQTAGNAMRKVQASSLLQVSKDSQCPLQKLGSFGNCEVIAAETNLDVETAKVSHEVLQRFHHCHTLMADYSVENHLDAQAKDGDEYSCAKCHAETECGRSQADHPMNPDHEDGGAPMVVVTTGMLGLGIDVAEWYLIRL